MFGLAIDGDGLATASSDHIAEQHGWLKAGAALIECYDLQIGTELDAARIWWQISGDEIYQRGFASAIGADNA